MSTYDLQFPKGRSEENNKDKWILTGLVEIIASYIMYIML
jgi:hypothetical protein